MRNLAAIALLVAGVAWPGQQQTGASPGVPVPAAPEAQPQGTAKAAVGPRVFRLHVVDGRNGSPVAKARVSLWYDEMDLQGTFLQTNELGMAAMPQPVGVPLRVLVTPAGFVDCRKQGRDAPPMGYNLQAIAVSGLAGENTCGSIAIKPEPGELIVYVRPVRWYEGLNR